ncbi:hypothetical protein [Thermobrachium celere]|uniref:Uncharacterized protein n=1 Tax=Thermobrachium celere DSM 8682 TaxID=941824 RepID=R7RQV3_9CLOT|nr:hypothetical protein [Thermobrachium celere]CDF57731.1 hypothetical protein TCEL_01645 [Thermobrachium celere DSM 8682]
MKARKFALSLALALTVFSTTFASAATKQDVINALRRVGANSAIITMAENYLKTVSISEDKLDLVVQNINDVKALMDARGVTDVTKLSREDKEKVIAEIQDSARIVGLTAEIVTGKNGVRTVKLVNEKGKIVAVVAGNGKIMKKTGTANALGMAVGSLTAVAGLLALRKRK